MNHDIRWYQNPGEGDRVGLWNVSWFEQLYVAVSLRGLRLECLQLERPWKAFHCILRNSDWNTRGRRHIPYNTSCDLTECQASLLLAPVFLKFICTACRGMDVVASLSSYALAWGCFIHSNTLKFNEGCLFCLCNGVVKENDRHVYF